jgi:hypothetical protein
MYALNHKSFIQKWVFIKKENWPLLKLFLCPASPEILVNTCQESGSLLGFDACADFDKIFEK